MLTGASFMWHVAQVPSIVPCRAGLLMFQLAGTQPAVPNNTAPCAACGLDELVNEASARRLWQR